MDKRFVLAARYAEAGLDDEAWALVRELLPSTEADVLRFAATLRLKAGASPEALDLADQTIALDRADNTAWHIKGRAHHLCGDLAAAEAALREAVRLGATKAWNDLGNVLADANQPGAAMTAFEAALAADPESSASANNLGATLASQGQFAAAAACYRRALAGAPGNLAAQINLGVALLEQGEAEAAIAVFDAVLAVSPGHKDAGDNRLYARLYISDDPALIAGEHKAWGALAPAPDPLPIQDADSGRRLRVGYVSPDFRRHSVAFFLAPLVDAHDPEALEVFCYADVVRPDAVTQHFAALVPHWRNVHGLSDDALHARIAADRIDILVDLAGHTQGNRLGVFARRAAPLQVTGLGYPATTGVKAMDVRLCDGITDPPAGDAHASETLLRLVPGLHCYTPPPSPNPAPLPALTRGHITFGSFNKLAKISGACVRLWAQVLAAVPGARLLIKSKALAEDSTRAGLAARFAAAGVDPAQLELTGWRPEDGDHLALYGQVDIALDTIPYNGTTTTCEALWMGVPVLTLAGRSHAGRVSASLLAAAGLEDWVAATPADFVAIAKAKADDVTALRDLRGDLRARVAGSALCDARAHARGLEAAYRDLWRRKITGN